MQTKHLTVLNHMRNKGEAGTVKMLKPLSNFLTDHSQAVRLLWIILIFLFRVILPCLLFAALCLRCKGKVSNC